MTAMTTDLTTSEPVHRPRHAKRAPRLAVDKAALAKLRLVAVAYSHVKSAWFPTQEAYQAEVLPTDVPQVVIEAGTPVGWKDLLGANTEAVGIDHYGASADAKTLFKEFGITADAAVEKAKALIG